MEQIAENFRLHLSLVGFMVKEGVNPLTYPFVVIQTEVMRTNLCLN